MSYSERKSAIGTWFDRQPFICFYGCSGKPCVNHDLLCPNRSSPAHVRPFLEHKVRGSPGFKSGASKIENIVAVLPVICTIIISSIYAKSRFFACVCAYRAMTNVIGSTIQLGESCPYRACSSLIPAAEECNSMGLSFIPDLIQSCSYVV